MRPSKQRRLLRRCILNLKELQEQFLNSVLCDSFDEGIKKSMIPGGKLDKVSCLQAYKNDYTARLSSALGDNFESIWTILGDEDFFKLTHHYIKEHPSSHYDLGEFGNELPNFLINHELPYLSELAILEIEFRRLFNSSPSLSVDQEKLAALGDPSEVRFNITSLSYLSSSKFPLYRIWELRGQNSEEKFKKIEWKPENFFMYNSTGTVQVLFLSNNQKDLLKALISGQTLGAALEKLEGIEEVEVQELFTNLVINNLIVDLK